jgi:hypothetical protein
MFTDGFDARHWGEAQALPSQRLTESRPYRSPELHQIGALEHLQGSGGVFRDTVWPPGLYPRHD